MYLVSECTTISDPGDIDDVTCRVSQRLTVHGLGFAIDQCGHRVEVLGVCEPHLDAHLREGVREQVVGAAVQRRHADEVIAGFGNRLNGVGRSRLAGSQRQPGSPALHVCNTLLQHVVGRVHDAAVDIPQHRQVEQVGAVLSVVEGVRGSLVNRNCDGLGGGIRAIARVHCFGLDFHYYLLRLIFWLWFWLRPVTYCGYVLLSAIRTQAHGICNLPTRTAYSAALSDAASFASR
jgi:hypothetical protein